MSAEATSIDVRPLPRLRWPDDRPRRKEGRRAPRGRGLADSAGRDRAGRPHGGPRPAGPGMRLGSSAIAACIVDLPERPRGLAATVVAGSPLTGLTVGAVRSGRWPSTASPRRRRLRRRCGLAAACAALLLVSPERSCAGRVPASSGRSTTFSGSASDRRAFGNAPARLKRSGFQWRGLLSSTGPR